MGAKKNKVYSGTHGKNKYGNAPKKESFNGLLQSLITNKTYCPVKPKKFVSYEFGDLSPKLEETLCCSFWFIHCVLYVLATDKGPSCSNIVLIPHRKVKVNIKN